MLHDHKNTLGVCLYSNRIYCVYYIIYCIYGIIFIGEIVLRCYVMQLCATAYLSLGIIQMHVAPRTGGICIVINLR